MTVRRHRLNPFKVLCLLLYGEYEFVKWDNDNVSICKGPFARLLRVPNSRLEEYMKWLDHWDYVTDLDITRGQIDCRVNVPARWSDLLTEESFLPPTQPHIAVEMEEEDW